MALIIVYCQPFIGYENPKTPRRIEDGDRFGVWFEFRMRI
jgi:hypothetical protein